MGDIPLCALEDIENNGSAGFAVETDGKEIGVMAIRQGDEVFTYVNSCPHIGAPLDFKPGQFLDILKQNILCSTHGALFRIRDGHCISGPCVGRDLTRVENVTHDKVVYVML